jgi:hypothetical protein
LTYRSLDWYRVRSSRKGSDVPKRLTILTGLGRHSYSSKRALKEVCHAVKVGIWPKLSLFFGPSDGPEWRFADESFRRPQDDVATNLT